jgi:hypothetical protein
MRKYEVTLTITTDLNPGKWNWHELIGLEGEEEMFVEVEEVNV